MRNKKSSELGWEVHAHLVKNNVEAPFYYHGLKGRNIAPYDQAHPDAAQAHIAAAFAGMITGAGLDMSNDSLAETPQRVADMYVNELFYGLDYNNFPKATVQPNDMGYDEMVVVRGIPVKSFCEHHFIPFFGTATIAYIPSEKVLGLSKFHRITDFFSRRPQVQERLTEQVWHALSFILATEDVAVMIKAEHMCVKLRGAEAEHSDTVTSKLGPTFRKASVRAEFFALAQGSI